MQEAWDILEEKFYKNNELETGKILEEAFTYINSNVEDYSIFWPYKCVKTKSKQPRFIKVRVMN